MVSQPLCPGLADMELGPDGAHRGDPVHRQLPGEQLSRPLLQRIRVKPGPGCRVRRNLGTADNHHEQLVRADQRNCGPRRHPCADQAMSQAVHDIGRERRRDAQAEQPPRERGTGVLLRAESSITIELA